MKDRIENVFFTNVSHGLVTLLNPKHDVQCTYVHWTVPSLSTPTVENRQVLGPWTWTVVHVTLFIMNSAQA